MKTPYISEKNNQRGMTQTFLGLDRRERIADGAWSEMRNMTVDGYPVAGTRRPRRVAAFAEQDYVFDGLGGHPVMDGKPTASARIEDRNGFDSIIMLSEGGKLYKQGTPFWENPLTFHSVGLDDPGDQIAVMGRKIITNRCGVVEDISVVYSETEIHSAYAKYSGKCTLLNVNADGSTMTVATGSEPQNPANGDYWYDSKRGGLYCYSSSSGDWVPTPTSYILLTFDESDGGTYDGDSLSLFDNSQRNDCVRLSFPPPTNPVEYLVWLAWVAILSADGQLENYFNNYIVEKAWTETDEQTGNTLRKMMLRGTYLPSSVFYRQNPQKLNMQVERRAPVMDYIVEHKNRIWGCRYGENDKGQFVNEIYASALGDPLNWFRFEGTAADSYMMSVGTGGPFTGATATEDYVIFFKEDRCYLISGDEPANFRRREVPGPGVQAGSARSAVQSGGFVYYKSLSGVMRLSPYNYPTLISSALGDDVWTDAIGGTDDKKYYLSMVNPDGVRELYAFDFSTGQWTQEDCPDGLTLMLQDGVGGILYVTAKDYDSGTSGLRRGKMAQASFDQERYSAADDTPWRDFIYALSNILAFPNATTVDGEKFEDNLAARKATAALEIINCEETYGISFETEDLKLAFSDRVLAYDDMLYLRYEYEYRYSEIGFISSGARSQESIACLMPAPWNSETQTGNTGVFMPESGVEFFGVTGLRGLSNPDVKRVNCIKLRLKCDAGTRLKVSLMYDEDGTWEKILDEQRRKTGTFVMKLFPQRRCDLYRLKIEGNGQTVIYSITEELEDAGDSAVGV